YLEMRIAAWVCVAGLVVACFTASSVALPADDAASKAGAGEKGASADSLTLCLLPTHDRVGEIEVLGTDGKTRLQTFCTDADGHILALVAPERSYGAPLKDSFGEVHIISSSGKTIDTWKVKFHANSINIGPDGTVYVAGDGRVAKFDQH